MNLVFNAAASDPASALVRSVLQTTPASKPVFVLGDSVEIDLYIGDGAGGYDARSGAADVTPWLGIGTPGAAPTGGTFFLAVSSATSGAFTVGKRYWIKNYMAGDYFLDAGASADETGVIFIATAVYPDTWSFGSEVCEITEDIAFNASAATVEAALEATQAVVGVAVTKPGSAPIYSVQWDTVGARSALIGGPALLTPSSAAVVSVIDAGDSSTQARQIVRLTQKPAALQVTWTLIDNGWNAILDCNTEGLLELLDGAASVSSKLELQLVDGDGNITTVGQVDCLIRNEAIDEESTVPLDLPAYLTASQTLLQCVQNRYAVTALTGGGTALDGIVTGPSASPSVSTNALAAIELSGVLSFYELVTGTDAESSPDVIRPDDYDGSTNERVWKLRGIDLPAYLTASQTLLQCVQNRYAVTALTGGGTALDGIVTGPSASPSVSTNSLAAIELSGVLSFYELVTGTDAESSPDVIRPDDYEGSTNARVWKLRGNTSTSAIQLYVENPSSATAPSAAGANAVSIGSDCAAAGDKSICVGGTENQSTANWSTTLGGNLNIASAQFSIATGYAAKADKIGQQSHGTVPFGVSATTVSQTSRMIVSVATLDGTQTELLAGSQRLTLSDNTTWAFRVLVVARRTDASENDGWEASGLIHRDANAASTILDSVQMNHLGAAAWDVMIDADTTNGALRIRVTGESSKSISWLATVFTSEISI